MTRLESEKLSSYFAENSRKFFPFLNPYQFLLYEKPRFFSMGRVAP
ncbi:hypothetical protein LEP1GSC058_2214 [Leptospira fainei serovar Hurstbridge str. BUT 6]|uniref:Uncharacterized protein n=1 Tax=Leptospira fainei serovar Hurstbridge str. BUT 6 TaxID=1193011 RepID=S3V2A8_9LEPT|nr:hypothetical protein LEP1GSC058_2214 [Leptospira fainei serovar Hurstbridge str. BUT 6]